MADLEERPAKTELDELKAEVKKLQAQVESLQKQLETLQSNVPGPSQEPLNEDNAEANSLDSDGADVEGGDGDQGPGTEIPPHPALLMDDVLGEILKLLDWDSLKSTRLVCSKWAKVSTPAFLAKGKMSVGQLDGCSRFVQDFESVFPSSTPDSKRIKSLKIQKPSIFHYMLPGPWFRSYGATLERLELVTWIYKEEAHLPDLTQEYIEQTSLVDLLLNTCPNLKELILSNPFVKEIVPPPRPNETSLQKVTLDLLKLGPVQNMNRHYLEGSTVYCNTLRFLFSCIAGLKTLVLQNSERTSLDGFFDGLQEPESHRELRVLEGVESLDFTHFCTHWTLLSKLCEIKFFKVRVLKFGRLHLRYTAPPSYDDFYRLLAKISPTLEELTLGDCDDDIFSIALPALPKLKILTIVDVGNWHLESMDFVSILPSLEVLDLGTSDLQWLSLRDFLPFSSAWAPSAHLGLKEFRFRSNLINDEGFKLLDQCYPNVERIKGNVCGGAENVKNALIGLAGLLKLEVLDLELPYEIDAESLTQVFASTLPNFPALKKLALRHDCDNWITRNFTGEMFTTGFLKCPTLKRLDLYSIELSAEEDWDSVLNPGNRV